VAARPKAQAPTTRWITTGAAARILGKSPSQVYRYVESGDLHPINTLPPGAALRGKRKRTLAFEHSEVATLALKINPSRG
jgi:predicted DNA-binding transcriptional regulator AlpA